MSLRQELEEEKVSHQQNIQVAAEMVKLKQSFGYGLLEEHIKERINKLEREFRSKPRNMLGQIQDKIVELEEILTWVDSKIQTGVDSKDELQNLGKESEDI